MQMLFLSQYYSPEPGIKSPLLAQDLAARGHQVTVITGFPNYPAGKLYPGYCQSWRQWEQDGDVRVLRLPLYPDHSRSGVRRALNYLSFAASASILGPILCGPSDVMWVYHPPLTVGIPAWWIGLLRRVPFIYEIQDMWPETVLSTEMMAPGVATELLKRLGKLIYDRANAITVISPGFQRNLIDKGVPAEKIHVIPNWADEELYRPVPPDESLAEEHDMAGRFNIVYGGNLGAAQAMQNVLAAAALLRDLPQIQFVLIGDGLDAADLRREAAERRLDNVRFIGQQPAEQMPHFFALADVLLTHLKRDPLFEITIPSKTLAYMACGRPILAAVAGDAADVVRDAGAGMVCPPEDPIALARAVRALVALPTAERERMGQAGRQTFLEHYTRAVLVDRYEELFRVVVRRSTHRSSTTSEWQAS
jgi:colanic acid biosynthesis glycosyl transferase WcaI